MANSSLFRTGEQDPTVHRGHGTGALGPSDSSDSGSDVRGGPGLNFDDDDLGLDRGTTSDADVDGPGANAGADMGDADLDSDSDRNGAGERAAAGRDSTLPTDAVMHEGWLASAAQREREESPLDFSDRSRPGRVPTEPLDEAADDDAFPRVDDLDEEQTAPASGRSPAHR